MPVVDKAIPFKEADGSTIDNADASALNVGGVPVVRARTNITDPTDPAGIAKVENTRPGAADYGVVTRPLVATDGTHDVPTMDAPARPGFVKVTDGANTMPTMDSAARPGFVTVTDLGTHADTAMTDPTNVTSAATLIALAKGVLAIYADVHDATDHALAVNIVKDSTPSIPNPLPTLPSDGTNAAAIKPASTPAAATDPALVVDQRPSENHIGEVGGPIANVSVSFTRPANTTAYASGQLVADNTAAASVTPMAFVVARVAAGSFMVRRAKLKKSTTTTTGASFRLHLFTSIPNNAAGGLTSGDGAALAVNANGYLGAIDLDMTSSSGRVWADSVTVHGVPNTGSEISVKLSSGQTIYGLLEARGAYTPGSAETLTVVLEILQN